MSRARLRPLGKGILLPAVLWLAVLCLACAAPETPQPGPAPSTESETESTGAVLVEATTESGLDFVHFNGMSGRYYFAEMMGSGAALLDFDNDGDLDLYLVQGSMLGDPSASAATITPRAADLPLRDRLLRNDLTAGSVRFVDVTASSGLDVIGYGMGVAAADFDRDGWTDLYVTQLGANRHLRNLGDGTFEDVTDAVTGIQRWSVAASAADFDGDGWLDLFVGNYLEYSTSTDKDCTDELGQANYCGPLAFRPEPDHLLRNRGDGTFEEWSGRAGIQGEYGGCLGSAVADFDGDGRLDIYVANDGMANQLWLQREGLRFENRALLGGAAVSGLGQPEASMGVAITDFDHDGDEDIFLTHLSKESNTLYINQGDGSFRDGTNASGLAAASFERTGFGSGWLDLENDGWLDLLVVNGAVKVIKTQALAGEPLPLRQPNLLFRNLGDGRFEDISAQGGEAITRAEVSRGAAFGDLDNDGDTDVVMTQNNGPARLLLNGSGQDAQWLGIRLVNEAGSDILGAQASVIDGNQRWLRRVGAIASYASSSDPRLLFGLGSLVTDNDTIEAVEVRWPDGSTEQWRSLPLATYSVLVRGTGTALTTGSSD